jgi:alkylation response protein AidB-like acyl-CoA dehydrogenase
VDPSRAPARISFRNAQAEKLGATSGWSGVRRLLDRAAIVLAFEQLGTADAALELAKDYALNRRAFGRPIGSFQAIKHKLADVYIANELARSNAYYAAWALHGRCRWARNRCRLRPPLHASQPSKRSSAPHAS